LAVKHRYALQHFGFLPGTRIMTDTTAANSNDVADDGAAGALPDVAALAKEIADYKDRLLRALADMENLRRRTDREVADVRTYGVTSIARDMVGVADNMRRALDAAGDAGIAVEGPAKALLEGVELTERELLKVLERHGVRKFEPHGAKFDPNLHQAMFEVPDANTPSGSVVQVVQPGYMIGDRVLRPAMVGVSKGGPRTAPPDRSADEKQSS
jgi:molecular chaperone GrpE